MSSGVANLADLAQDLLAGVAAQLVADGVDAAVVPARRYLTFGTPVGDCDALVVSMERVFQGTPGVAESPAVLRANVVRSAVLSVWLFRCLSAVPEGEGIEAQIAPSPESLTADARLVMTDAYELHRAVGKARNVGLFRDFKLAASVGPALPVQPQGGIGGVTVAVTVELS